MFKHGHQLTLAIQSIVRVGPADLAVAYWGNDACAKLKLPANLDGFRVACDAYSGFCGPLALQELLERGATIVDVPMLHAKVYRTDTAMVVASANASSRGLNLDELASHGLEAGIVATNPDRLADAKEWFNKVFESGDLVQISDLSAIRAAWDSRRASRILRTSLVEALLSASDSLKDRAMRVFVYTADVPSSAIQKAYKKTPYYDSARWNPDEYYPFFWGETANTNLQKEDLLCFRVENGKAESEGVWRILDKIGSGDKAIWPAQIEPLPFGRILGPTNELNRRVSAAVRDGRLDVDGEPIALDAFAASISDVNVEHEHIARIKSASVRQSYVLLIDQLKRLGLRSSYKSGKVPAVRWRDARERYVFAFIPNNNHLLFYVRTPALAATPKLAGQAAALGLVSEVNRATEITLRIETVADATVIIEWLQSVLPLQ